MNDHKFHDREDDLQHCMVCNGAEGSLPIECPGRAMTAQEQDEVMAGELNFSNRKWWSQVHAAQHARPDEPDLIARGMAWEEAVKVCRESCEQAGFSWDKITPTALNVLQRTANNAHKLGFKLGLERAASAQQAETDKLRVALRETQHACNVSQCPWCGTWGQEYAESERPADYCHHEYSLTPWRSFFSTAEVAQPVPDRELSDSGLREARRVAAELRKVEKMSTDDRDYAARIVERLAAEVVRLRGAQ